MLIAALAILGTIDQKRVHLIDSYPRDVPRNFLFRGNNPTNKTENGYTFDYGGLVASLRKSAETECGVELPGYFRVVDVDLENLSDPGYVAELEFWKQHPSLGEVLHWTTLGTLLDVKKTPFKTEFIQNGSWAIQGDADRLIERLSQLHSMLANVSSVPMVFYVHCNAGCDRTGEFMGAHTMRYLGYNVTTALGEAQRQCGRAPNFFATESVGWWCLTLKERFGRTDVGDCLNAFGCHYFGDCDLHGATPLANPCPK